MRALKPYSSRVALPAVLLAAGSIVLASEGHTALLDNIRSSPATASAGQTAAIRVYVSGESIEHRNRFIAPPFNGDGSLNDRGGDGARNDNDEYGWLVPLRDRLTLRDPGLTIVFVGADVWADAEDMPYTGTYPSATPEPTSAISGTSIPSWLEERRAELESRVFCYDLAFAARGGNDFDTTDDAEFIGQLKELVHLLANGSNCRPDPVIIVTGHMPDDRRGGEPDAEFVATLKHRYVERVRQAVDELQLESPAPRVHFADAFTPFVENRATTAFPHEEWSILGVFDFVKIGRIDDGVHPRRLASIFIGEVVADSLALTELRTLVARGPRVRRHLSRVHPTP